MWVGDLATQVSRVARDGTKRSFEAGSSDREYPIVYLDAHSGSKRRQGATSILKACQSFRDREVLGQDAHRPGQ